MILGKMTAAAAALVFGSTAALAQASSSSSAGVTTGPAAGAATAGVNGVTGPVNGSSSTSTTLRTLPPATPAPAGPVNPPAATPPEAATTGAADSSVKVMPGNESLDRAEPPKETETLTRSPSQELLTKDADDAKREDPASATRK